MSMAMDEAAAKPAAVAAHSVREGRFGARGFAAATTN